MKTAILASQNKNKIKEIQAILGRHGFTVISRDDAGIPDVEIEETGVTFDDNSFIKASAIADMMAAGDVNDEYRESPVIADDSGLMVDVLGGAPGIYSARYAGIDCTYDDNNAKLLTALKDVPTEKRGACFVTVITMLWPDDTRLTAKGECRGHIVSEARGSNGFGYDPLFVPDGYTETFAEMDTNAKNSISHRARALAELERLLEQKSQAD